MSTIPISVTQEQFEEYIRPALTTAKRGFECQIALYKVFNYILYHLHTGCQWYQLPIQNDGEKKRLVGKRSTTISVSGVETGAWQRCLSEVSQASTLR